MAWIESHQGLPRHPKTKKLARKLGTTIPTTIGHLHMLWWWAMDYCPDGDLSRFDLDDIADACEWSGESEVLMTSLVESGFVDKSDDVHRIHDWYDYVGKLLDKRALDAERKRNGRGKKETSSGKKAPIQRTSNGHPEDGARTVPDLTVPDLPNRTEPTIPYLPNKTEEQRTTTNAFELFDLEGFGDCEKEYEPLSKLVRDYGHPKVCEALQEASIENKKDLLYVRDKLELIGA